MTWLFLENIRFCKPKTPAHWPVPLGRLKLAKTAVKSYAFGPLNAINFKFCRETLGCFKCVFLRYFSLWGGKVSKFFTVFFFSSENIRSSSFWTPSKVSRFICFHGRFYSNRQVTVLYYEYGKGSKLKPPDVLSQSLSCTYFSIFMKTWVFIWTILLYTQICFTVFYFIFLIECI